MGENYSEEDEEDVLDRLLKLNSENLEDKVKEIESEISERQRIKAKILQDMDHEILKTHEKMDCLRYPIFHEMTLKNRRALENQMINLEKRKAETIETCFNDTMKLKKELRDIKAKLKHEKEKQSLILK